MTPQAWSDRVHPVRPFLDDHPAVRRFALPFIFMGSVITAPLLASDVTLVEAGRVAGLFLLASVAVSAVGLGAERA
ncbi:hypothetical protein [Natrialba sp. PRR66]|uniref:hypothetical protein n=1 Tax=Natrialba sp. PRR66 TaxID=3098146 RepID=UPI002B1D7E28|nr:hypothetical protein [Natrialba sp. PRR66]